jgi:hypothetical protein
LACNASVVERRLMDLALFCHGLLRSISNVPLRFFVEGCFAAY